MHAHPPDLDGNYEFTSPIEQQSACIHFQPIHAFIDLQGYMPDRRSIVDSNSTLSGSQAWDELESNELANHFQDAMALYRDPVDDVLTYIITPHGSYVDEATNRQFTIVQSVARDGSSQLSFCGGNVVRGLGPDDPDLPAEVDGVNLRQDIYLRPGQRGAEICAYLRVSAPFASHAYAVCALNACPCPLQPQSAMPLNPDGEARHPNLPPGPSARPHEVMQGLVPAKVFHLACPAARFLEDGYGLHAWTQLLVDVGEGQLLWPGGMQRVITSEGRIVRWETLDAAQHRSWILQTPVQGMLYWYHVDREADKYAARHPNVIEVLAEVRPYRLMTLDRPGPGTLPTREQLEAVPLLPRLVWDVLEQVLFEQLPQQTTVAGVPYLQATPSAVALVKAVLEDFVTKQLNAGLPPLV